MDKLKTVREAISGIDGEVYPLIARRMQLSEEVAQIKRAANLPILDEERERAVVMRATELAGEQDQGEAAVVARCIMTLSRARQRRLLHGDSFPMPAFAAPTAVAEISFFGVPGAFTQEAAEMLYPDAVGHACDAFEDVFAEVLSGKTPIGVVPIENSLSGAINEVYDLLRRHGCFITGEVVLPIEQCLLGIPGSSAEGIKKVTSKMEALKQCRQAIRSNGWEAQEGGSTALAAQRVAQAGDPTLAAIGSARAAKLYGLTVLQRGIQANKANRTRFIAISAAPVADPLADRMAATFVTRHYAGALSDVLLSLGGAGINLTRILSQPDGSGGYRFFIDIDADWREEYVRKTLSHTANACEYFEILGVYKGRPADQKNR